MLDIIDYAVEYLDGHNASLASSSIVENIFSQVDEEGDIFVLFYEILYHRVDDKLIMPQEALVI